MQKIPFGIKDKNGILVIYKDISFPRTNIIYAHVGDFAEMLFVDVVFYGFISGFEIKISIRIFTDIIVFIANERIPVQRRFENSNARSVIHIEAFIRAEPHASKFILMNAHYGKL